MKKYDVIIVDDEPYVRDVLKKSMPWDAMRLNLLGAFSSGEDALRFLINNHCDVVLSDIMMERISGLDLAEWMLQNRPGSFIILLTGYSQFELAQRACDLGVARYLLKPVDPAKLCQTFSEVIENLDRERDRKRQSALKTDAYVRSAIDLCVYQLLHKETSREDIIPLLNTLPLVGSMCLITSAPENPAGLEEYEWIKVPVAEMSLTLYIFPAEELPAAHRHFPESDQTQYHLSVYDALSDLMTRREAESSAPDLIRLVMQYLEAHYEDATVSKVAEHFYISPSHLSHLLREKTGKTFIEILLSIRMEKAVSLLRDTRMNVGEVSRAVGYQDSRYFSRVFSQQYGMTPSAFRLRHSGEVI